MRLKRRKFFVVVLLCSVLAFIFVSRSHDSGPIYKGKNLDQWIEGYKSTAYESLEDRYYFTLRNSNHITGSSLEAVRAIGTNSLPSLLDWIRKEPSPPSKAKEFLSRTLQRLPPFILPKNVWRWKFWLNSTSERQWAAVIGFTMLGSTAEPAIPELKRLASASTGTVVPERAVDALIGIGPIAVPALFDVIKTTNSVGGAWAIYGIYFAIDKLGTNAVPGLLDCLDNPEPTIAICAAHSLATLKAEPAVVLTKMTKLLQQEQWAFRANVIISIAEYGELARPMVPELIKAFADQDSSVRDEATNALMRIAPEVLPYAAPK